MYENVRKGLEFYHLNAHGQVEIFNVNVDLGHEI